MNAIEISGLSKYYGKARGIIGMDLSIAEGEFFGFIGPNGAGKSTTIRTLLGLIRPSAGSARIFGKDVVTQRNDVLAQVGYLPSEAIFYTGMRVRDILQFSASLRKKDCTQEAKRLCERLELDVSKRIETLSLGNRKKVGIVCALQSDPPLCILDEPTSGLDPLMQREFFDILMQKHAQGTTVFLSSHVLKEIQRHCTRAAIVREGKIIACERVEALYGGQAKRIWIKGVANLSGMEGVRDVQYGKEEVRFLYNGDMQALLRALAGQAIEDITMTEPDLEEIFLHYYQGEKEGKEK